MTALTGGSNSGHTKKPKYEFTWDMLHDIDPGFTTFAQLMAFRSGYDLEPEAAARCPFHSALSRNHVVALSPVVALSSCLDLNKNY